MNGLRQTWPQAPQLDVLGEDGSRSGRAEMQSAGIDRDAD